MEGGAEVPRANFDTCQTQWWALGGVRFSRCEVCWQLSRQLNDRTVSLEIKLGAVQKYRDHLHSQYVDRSIQRSLNELSRDTGSGVLVVLVDGLDQAKFRIPKHPGLRAVSSLPPGFVSCWSVRQRSNLVRPSLTIHGSWAVGALII